MFLYFGGRKVKITFIRGIQNIPANLKEMSNQKLKNKK